MVPKSTFNRNIAKNSENLIKVNKTDVFQCPLEQYYSKYARLDTIKVVSVQKWKSFPCVFDNSYSDYEFWRQQHRKHIEYVYQML